jgi:signal peptidase II
MPKPNALNWLWLAAVVIVLDQLSKWWVLSSVPVGAQVPVVHGFLYWTLTFNEGAAFSFLADGGGWQRWFFVLLALVISVVLAVWLQRTARRDWRTAAPLALIVGGALGNAIDRVHAGRVTDFVLVYFGDWAYPAFNLADSAICVGAVALVVFSLLSGKPRTDVR